MDWQRGRKPANETVRRLDIDRRTVLVGGAALSTGVAGGIGAAEAAGKDRPERMPVAEGDRFMLRKGPAKGELLRPDTLVIDAQGFEAFPYDPASEMERDRNRLNRLIVLRLDPEDLDAETRAMSANGVLAFSAVCTHQGCTIGAWVEETRHLKCHCHLSEFDATAGGAVRGGPARRQPPMVPLAIDMEGYVVATGPFTAEPGGERASH